MKSTELRIGNWIISREFRPNGFKIHQSDIHLMTQANYDFSDYEPIPLTEDWLVKFGLSSDDFITLEKNECILLDIHQQTVWIGDKTNFEYAAGIHCKYVHQLQNLYFALTGEELEVK